MQSHDEGDQRTREPAGPASTDRSSATSFRLPTLRRSGRRVAPGLIVGPGFAIVTDPIRET